MPSCFEAALQAGHRRNIGLLLGLLLCVVISRCPPSLPLPAAADTPVQQAEYHTGKTLD